MNVGIHVLVLLLSVGATTDADVYLHVSLEPPADATHLVPRVHSSQGGNGVVVQPVAGEGQQPGVWRYHIPTADTLAVPMQISLENIPENYEFDPMRVYIPWNRAGDRTDFYLVPTRILDTATFTGQLNNLSVKTLNIQESQEWFHKARANLLVRYSNGFSNLRRPSTLDVQALFVYHDLVAKMCERQPLIVPPHDIERGEISKTIGYADDLIVNSDYKDIVFSALGQKKAGKVRPDEMQAGKDRALTIINAARDADAKLFLDLWEVCKNDELDFAKRYLFLDQYDRLVENLQEDYRDAVKDRTKNYRYSVLLEMANCLGSGGPQIPEYARKLDYVIAQLQQETTSNEEARAQIRNRIKELRDKRNALS